MHTNENQHMFTVEGKIQALQLAPGVENLLEDIRKGAFVTGVIVGAGGADGVLANNASLVMYDGENVEHLALLINGRLAVGTFEWLRDLHVGDDVILVVSQISEGPLFVHAILRKNDQLLWTPISVSHTRHGWKIHGLKLSGLLLAFTWLMCGVCWWSSPDYVLTTSDLTIVGIFPIALIGFCIFMSIRDTMPLGYQAEKIFRALDAPKFERFSIRPYSVCNLHLVDDPNALKKRYIFQFSDAVMAHRQRFNIL
jgi:hypothetical protein